MPRLNLIRIFILVPPWPSAPVRPVPAGRAASIWYNIQFNIPVWNLNQGGIRAANANIRDAAASVGVLRNDLLRQAADTLAVYPRPVTVRVIHWRANPADRRADVSLDAERLRNRGGRRAAPFCRRKSGLTQVNLDYIEALESAWTNAAALAGLLQVELFP